MELVIVLSTFIVGLGYLSIISSVEKDFLNSDIAKPAFAAKTNDVYSFWFSNKTGNDEIKFSSSTDGGTTFTSNVNLLNSISPSDPKEVGISRGDDNIVISWKERSAPGNESSNDIVANNEVTAGIILLRLTNETRDTIE